MATQLFQAPHGSVEWFHMMVARAALEGRRLHEDFLLSPELAAEILRNNPDNRSLDKSTVRKIAKDILAGRWTPNGEPILISTDGLLNDGQHRLNAVIDTNMPIEVTMTFGVTRESRETLDQGRARTASDYLSMRGFANPVFASSIARFLIAYEASGGKFIGSRATIPNSEIVKRCEEDEALGESIRFTYRNSKHFRALATPQIVGFCHYVMSRISPADANNYMEQVCVGENIRKSYPAFAVRAGLMRERITTVEKIHIIFRGWNAYRQKRTLELSKVTGSNLPALV